jgi:hypothetical protein
VRWVETRLQWPKGRESGFVAVCLPDGETATDRTRREGGSVRLESLVSCSRGSAVDGERRLARSVLDPALILTQLLVLDQLNQFGR